MSACKNCPRSAECQQGRRCHIKQPRINWAAVAVWGAYFGTVAASLAAGCAHIIQKLKP